MEDNMSKTLLVKVVRDAQGGHDLVDASDGPTVVIAAVRAARAARRQAQAQRWSDLKVLADGQRFTLPGDDNV
jgi:hypothetical protein